jgi:hydrogenase nickel incorporation protein HypB
MCETCGCGNGEKGYKISYPPDSHEHDAGNHDHGHGHKHQHGQGHGHYHDGHWHSHDHDHDHDHSHDQGNEHDHMHGNEHDTADIQPETDRRIAVETDILMKNNLLAERNRGFFEARGIIALNLVSSPGSGKTTLLEKTIKLMSDKPLCVIEGDQQTTLDAERIGMTGAPALQINTGNGCHLDADMVNNAVKKLDPLSNSLLFIENVGNLVCPALFDLGETKRVVIISVTEGEDKPLKYPNMFGSSQLCLINKTDLLPYVDFNVEKLKEYAQRVNPALEFISLSAKTDEGMDKWIGWIERLKNH